ncbi:MAG: MFS transporter [Melioribacteraceae bacterium]|nr:MFS transporter [Melioribacteraceae bacterium]MCF8355811.1 MFS transporter [Melioribacteraceae bacterium]MCF8395301.1 MFS transporter [Melioribacteraceae bacterium]MCF8420749.1 MFS transporter [Melioribacteraceae bacterium]
MTADTETTIGKESWRFPKEFWLANFMELCERAAYYGFFIVLTLYLTDIVGFTDTETGVVAGIFFAGLYLLPPFVGAIGDKIGFKNGLILAFALLTIGYFFLGVFYTKGAVIFFLFVVLIGGSFIKPLITGTVAKTSTEENRARGFSLFYWIVNIGAFSGKTFVPYIRQGIGLEYVNFFSAGMSFLALLFALFFFRPIDASVSQKSLKQVFNALIKIFSTPRLIILTFIVTGFWIIQHQLYATMPKYVIRLLGEDAKPEWLANVNPLVVVLFVVLITQLFKKKKAVTAMLIGMILMPFSALAMAMSQELHNITGDAVSILGLVALHPLTVMMIIGIAIQGLAECFISPRFLEYFSFQAPKGEEGMYLGFSHLHSFFSALLGFISSGFLLDAYCPDPKTLPAGLTDAQFAVYYADAHVIWYYFMAVGFVSAIALFIFRYVTNKIDDAKEAESQT